MKRFLLSLAVLASATMIFAQKSTTKYQFTQAREPQVWVEPAIKPLVAEVEVVPNSRTSFTLGPEVLTNEFVEIALRGEVENVRNYGTFAWTKADNCDMIVAATYNLYSNPTGPGYVLEMRGFPAVFKNWHTATQADYEWMKIPNSNYLFLYKKDGITREK